MMGNCIWWIKIILAFFNKFERTAPSETSGKKTVVIHVNKLDERIDADKFTNYAIKEKLTTILDS